MTYFLYQIGLLSTVAILAGTAMGWWLHQYYKGEGNKRNTMDSDFSTVKNYLGESVKENARLKLQLKQAEEKIDKLLDGDIQGASGIDFDAYKAFENTIKEANLRKYLS